MRNPNRDKVFHFRQFDVSNCHAAMKVGTDGVLLGAWALHHLRDSRLQRVLDAGTGTGVIALMVAQEAAEAGITGIDIDPDAVAEAAGNFARSKWAPRLAAMRADFSDLAPGQSAGYDLVISNPPFFTNGETAPDAQRRQARHAGSLSPLTLTRMAPALLAPQGVLAMVSMPESRQQIETEIALARLRLRRLTEVVTIHGKAPRRHMWLIGTESQGDPVYDRLVIRERDNTPTESYARLVAPYYIDVK